MREQLGFSEYPLPAILSRCDNCSFIERHWPNIIALVFGATAVLGLVFAPLDFAFQAYFPPLLKAQIAEIQKYSGSTIAMQSASFFSIGVVVVAVLSAAGFFVAVKLVVKLNAEISNLVDFNRPLIISIIYLVVFLAVFANTAVTFIKRPGLSRGLPANLLPIILDWALLYLVTFLLYQIVVLVMLKLKAIFVGIHSSH